MMSEEMSTSFDGPATTDTALAAEAVEFVREEINETENNCLNDSQKPIQECHNNENKMEEFQNKKRKCELSETKQNSEEAMKCSVYSDIPLSHEEMGHLIASPSQDQSEEIVTANNNVNNPLVKDIWHTIGIIEGNKCEKQNYSMINECIDDVTLANSPQSNSIKLESDAAYKFRIAGMNSLGKGEWSQELLFKTRKAGLPGAPFVYNFGMTRDGAWVSWETPEADEGDNIEYSLYLSVRRETNENPDTLKFEMVYCGHNNKCFVSNSLLSAACIDTMRTPTIIFRILVKGDNGIGSVMQIRCSNVHICTNNEVIRHLLNIHYKKEEI